MKKRRPYKYQQVGVNRIHKKFGGVALLADEQGLGKSCQALLYRKKYLPKGKIVIICPATIKWNWQNEVKIWLEKQSHILEKRTPTPEAKRMCKTKKILIINYDILGDPKKKDSWVRYIRNVLKPDLMIVDECHNVKSADAQRTKAVRYLSRRTKKRIFASGTPMTNRPPELWPVLNMLVPDLFPSFRTFASRYSKPEWTPWGIKYKGAQRLNELHKLLKGVVMVRRLQKDVLADLPTKTRSIIPIELNSKEMADYRRAEDDFKNWLKKTHPLKANKMRSADRLVRFGYLRRLISQLKLPYVKKWIDDFLEESDSKLILFGVHKFVVKGLQLQYPGISTRIDGSVIGEKRQHAINSFTNNKRIRIMFGNIQAAGVGWNGTAANTCAFAELDWVPALHTQAGKRIHRIGQKQKTFENYLIVRGTIEQRLCEINEAKQVVIDHALDGGEQDDSFDVYSLLEASLLDG
jgi:SWI/SNF-related matrix-associated actin-dependent regulator 1 of chromatin subfamily A